MKLKTLLLLFVFAVACHPAKKPDPVDTARLDKMMAEQQKRAQRWNEIQQEAIRLQNEFQTAQKQYNDVQEDTFKRAGVDQKAFNLLKHPEGWVFVPVPKPAAVKPAAPLEKKK